MSPASERGPYEDLGSNRMSRRRDKTHAKERARHARAARREARAEGSPMTADEAVEILGTVDNRH